MFKRLVITALVLLVAFGAWPAIAQPPVPQGCQYFNLMMDRRSFAVVDPQPIPPFDYDVCVAGTRVTGALNGRYIFCLYFADFAITSDTVYGDGLSQLGLSRYAARIETPRGRIDLAERAWYDSGFGGAEAGIATVLGGTGDFQGAVGLFFWQGVKLPAPGQIVHIPYEGYICTP